MQLGVNEDTIHYNAKANRINCVRPEEGADNPNGILVYLDNLHVEGLTRGFKGNLFTYTMEQKDMTFPQALNNIAEWIGFKPTNRKTKYPFNGFYRKYLRNYNSLGIEILDTYDETELPSCKCTNTRFFDDGISLKTQEEWGLRYDNEKNEIVIPVYDNSNRLVGAKFRSNYDKCDFAKRWGMALPFAKAQVVYGWYKNYPKIARKRKVIVCESEKGVMQLASMNCNIGVAIGGHSLSDSQTKLIQALMPDDIILAYDEDVSEDLLVAECEKFKSLPFMSKFNVSYIYDKDRDLLKRGMKQSPMDLGYDGFVELCTKYLIQYNERAV